MTVKARTPLTSIGGVLLFCFVLPTMDTKLMPQTIGDNPHAWQFLDSGLTLPNCVDRETSYRIGWLQGCSIVEKKLVSTPDIYALRCSLCDAEKDAREQRQTISWRLYRQANKRIRKAEFPQIYLESDHQEARRWRGINQSLASAVEGLAYIKKFGRTSSLGVIREQIRQWIEDSFLWSMSVAHDAKSPEPPGLVESILMHESEATI